ncbi:MAG TPA: 30S ribosomal protein S14 [Candidatus Thermoplasmatota archaeon]|nr:30S ribosomal protein S14 [Candidatus Thermoplasmatota archaeon]
MTDATNAPELPPNARFGRGANRCQRCGVFTGLIRKYRLFVCRHCFREIGPDLGFKKYS